MISTITLPPSSRKLTSFALGRGFPRRSFPPAAPGGSRFVSGAHEQLDLHAARPCRTAAPQRLRRSRGLDLDLGARDGEPAATDGCRTCVATACWTQPGLPRLDRAEQTMHVGLRRA